MNKPDRNNTQQNTFINTLVKINTLKTTSILYILFSALTIGVAVNYFTGAWLFFEYMPRSFVYLNAIRNYAMPISALPLFYNFLIFFFVFSLFVGIMTLVFGKTPEKGGLLGLLGKIDLWLIIPIGIFTVFFVDGFGFIWFPIISLVPTILLLSGSAKLDNRPGRAARQESRTAKIFLIPAFLGLSFMTYIPLTAVFVISLFEWQIPFAPEFAGLTNLINLLSPGSFFWDSVRVTIIYAFLAVLMGMIYSMSIALLLNRKIPGRVFFRTVFYLPFVIPVVSSMMIFGLIYSHGGVINNIINMFGGNRIHFLLDNATIIPAIAIIAVWASGNTIVIKMAGLANVPRTYLESAEIDGANAWHRFWKITIPCMTPIIFYNLLMSLITHMQVVVPSLMLAAGGQAGATVIPQSFRFVAYELYTTAFGRGGFLGRAGALSFALFVLIGIFTVILFVTSKKWLFYEGGGPA
jgi:multiple sugar transport system permease protein